MILMVVLLGMLFLGTTDGNAASYPPLPEALAALESDVEVNVSQVIVPEWPPDSNFYFVFAPTTPGFTIGFIIYPGALVDPRSYAPIAHEIARQGFLTVIVKMVNDIAIGESAERASRVIGDYPGIEKWSIGGHSMGGVGASAYTKAHAENIDGVVLWASYPSETFRIDTKMVKAISIYGTNDGLTTLDEIEASRVHLPPYTQFVAIAGGNHTQFGWYDTSPNPIQPGDNPADLTRQEQQNFIVQATGDFLNYFYFCPNDPYNDFDNDSICGDIDSCPNIPNPLQEDNFPPQGNGIGDACDCEGNFNCDQDVDANDVITFLADFGRSQYNRPCTNLDQCKGDFSCDRDVDAQDVTKFLEDFGRSQYNNPCPVCVVGDWCVYP